MTLVVSCVVNWKKSQYPKIETRRLVIFLLSSLYKLHQMVPLTKHANHRTKCQKKNEILPIPLFWFFYSLQQVVHECNDSALIEGRRKEMLLLEQQLKFRENVKLFPLCSASRWLVKRGDVTRIYWKENAEAKLTFGRKVSKQTYNFLLFNDLLVVAKKKRYGKKFVKWIIVHPIYYTYNLKWKISFL